MNMQLMMARARMNHSSLAPPTQTVWDSTNKSSDIILSVSDTVAESNTSSGGGSVISVSSRSTGKFYAECVLLDTYSGSASSGFGFHKGSGSLGNFLGGDSNGWAVWNQDSGNQGTYANNSYTNNTVVAASVGRHCCAAIDLDAGKVWFKFYNSATWVGGGDPAAGSSPTYTFTPGGSWYLACCPRRGSPSDPTNRNKIGLVDVESWANPPPSGFIAWGPSGATASLTSGPTSSVSDTTARISFRASADSTVAVKYSTSTSLAGAATTAGVAVTSTTDFTGAIDLSGLTADTEYSYTIMVDGVSQFASPYPKTKTLPASASATSFSFVFGSCTRHNIGTDAIFGAVPSGPKFLMHLGDTIYADDDTPVATTLAQYRTKHRNAMAGGTVQTSGWNTLRKATPVFTAWDDHDLENDFSGGTGDALYAPALQAFQEYHGRSNPDSITSGELYYSFVAGDVGFFVCDLRSFRSINSAADNSSKTILGATQKAALKSWMLANNSALKIKFICCSVPAHGYAANTAGDSWGGIDDGTQAPSSSNGFRTERNELWDYIDTNSISGVVFISGDQHWSGSFKTTYAGRPRYELMASPFNNGNLTPAARAVDAVNGPIFWKYGAGRNFGVVSVDTTASPPTVSFQLYNASGSLGSSYVTSITQTQIDTGL